MKDDGEAAEVALMKRRILESVLFIVMASFFVAYADLLPPRFFDFAGFLFVSLGLYFIFGPECRKLARRYSARLGFIVTGLGTVFLGMATMGVRGVPEFRTPLGKLSYAGGILTFLGAMLIAVQARRKQSSARRESQDNA